MSKEIINLTGQNMAELLLQVLDLSQYAPIGKTDAYNISVRIVPRIELSDPDE